MTVTMKNGEPERLLEDPELAPYLRALQGERLPPERLEEVAQRLDTRVAREGRLKLWVPTFATLFFAGAAVAGVGVNLLGIELWGVEKWLGKKPASVSSDNSSAPLDEGPPGESAPQLEEQPPEHAPPASASPVEEGDRRAASPKPSLPPSAQLGEQVETYRRARELAEGAQRREAIALLEGLVRRYPSSPLLPEMQLDLAMWLEAEGRRHRAIRLLERGLPRAPRGRQQVVGYELLADMQLRAGDCPGAARTLARALEAGLKDQSRLDAGLVACEASKRAEDGE